MHVNIIFNQIQNLKKNFFTSQAFSTKHKLFSHFLTLKIISSLAYPRSIKCIYYKIHHTIHFIWTVQTWRTIRLLRMHKDTQLFYSPQLVKIIRKLWLHLFQEQCFKFVCFLFISWLKFIVVHMHQFVIWQMTT